MADSASRIAAEASASAWATVGVRGCAVEPDWAPDCDPSPPPPPPPPPGDGAAQAGRSRDSHTSNAEHGHCDDTTPPPNIHEGVDE